MSNATLAHFKLKPSSTIRKRPPLALHSDRKRGALFPWAGSTASNFARLLLTALILLLTASAQAQRPAATHIVRPGETLGLIAGRYGLDIPTLASANGIRNAHLIYTWQSLTIPADSAAQSAAPPIREIYVVNHGDTLGSIAEAYGLSVYELQAANNIGTWMIHVGQELKIPAGGAPPAAGNSQSASQTQTVAEASRLQSASPAQNPNTHTVQRGETLFRIARRYGISVASLIRINGIEDPTRIHAGNQLQLASGPASSPAAAPNAIASQAPAQASAAPPAPAPPRQSNHERYVVRRGDFLTQLGINLNTSWIALAKLNNLADPNNLHVGATLLIPQREDVERYDPKYAAWRYFDMIANQPGPRIGSGREIVIVLGTQSAYAYENGVLQKAARVSAGKKATPTIEGDHKIWLKRRSQTMSGPGYSLDNVEWVMYFYRDYAIHGAWWHMNFGTPMSHGCVNLTNADAQWFYNFASVGTPVYVRS
ncbi:MAG: LysM peptidoglycan-binding domain-containing protein [Chloroflexi bacterium]|nr:LysM peptidoglycan-binding domain-containing protein [Chloroflexota bacterium]